MIPKVFEVTFGRLPLGRDHLSRGHLGIGHLEKMVKGGYRNDETILLS